MLKVSKSALDIQKIVHLRILESNEHEGAYRNCKITLPRKLSMPEQPRYGSNWKAQQCALPDQETLPQCAAFVSTITEQAMKEFVCADA